MSLTVLSTQGLIPGYDETVSVIPAQSGTSCTMLHNILNTGSGTKVLGACLRLSKGGTIEALALGTPTVVFLISFAPPAPTGRKPNRGPNVPPDHFARETNLGRVLENPHCLLAGFHMPRLALLLHRQTSAHVFGVDLTTLHSKATREHTSAADLASTYLSVYVDKHRIHALWLRETDDDICLRAWLSACLAEKRIDAIAKAAKVDTRRLPQHHLACLSQLVLNVALLEKDKPTIADNDFENIGLDSQGQVVLHNKRFKTRVRKSRQTVVEINEGDTKLQAVGAKGKETSLKLVAGKLNPGSVRRVRVIGREEATISERCCDEHILLVLQGKRPLLKSPFVRMLWFPDDPISDTEDAESVTSSKTRVDGDMSAFERLNDSQRKVALAMIGDDQPIVVAHGPPGTGKTTTIACALRYWESCGQPVWVIARSNVGVKNIARSLFDNKKKAGKPAVDFKLIVSMEFHFEWHEHLYEGIEDDLIRTDDFGHGFDPRNQIGEAKVILCTLSMLSNPCLYETGVFRYRPVERLVVDEASQIDTFEFMHLFHSFEKLEKVCMFGDPKQLPPFGKEVAPNMQTIFDFKHLQSSSYFLDTQYRMPIPLGNFISRTVYDSKLKSEHEIHDIKTSKCLLFVDVRKGTEERAGESWKNTEEVNTIVNLVESFYHDKEFCIITPYDGQRAALAEGLRRAKLPADISDKAESFIFNVDSFQGHEKPYVIVSAVRTTAPGFLRSLNRMNVMLTRSQAGMVLVTKRAFLRGAGKRTLLSRLAHQWEHRVGEKAAWADAMEVANGSAALPGSLVPPVLQVEKGIPEVGKDGMRKQNKGGRGRRRRGRADVKGVEAVTRGMQGLNVSG